MHCGFSPLVRDMGLNISFSSGSRASSIMVFVLLVGEKLSFHIFSLFFLLFGWGWLRTSDPISSVICVLLLQGCNHTWKMGCHRSNPGLWGCWPNTLPAKLQPRHLGRVFKFDGVPFAKSLCLTGFWGLTQETHTSAVSQSSSLFSSRRICINVFLYCLRISYKVSRSYSLLLPGSPPTPHPASSCSFFLLYLF